MLPERILPKLEKELSIFQHLLKKRFYWILTQNLKGRDTIAQAEGLGLSRNQRHSPERALQFELHIGPICYALSGLVYHLYCLFPRPTLPLQPGLLYRTV